MNQRIEQTKYWHHRLFRVVRCCSVSRGSTTRKKSNGYRFGEIYSLFSKSPYSLVAYSYSNVL